MIYDGSNHAVWATNTVVPATPGVPGLVGRLLTGRGLLAGRSIHSADGRFTLLMQADGNLVLYGPGNQALWASGSSGHTDVWDAVMQSDGNLVVYDAHGTWCCMTRTTRRCGLRERQGITPCGMWLCKATGTWSFMTLTGMRFGLRKQL